MPTKLTIAATDQVSQLSISSLGPMLIFCTVLCCAPDIVAVHIVPHAYPLGQHPPPSLTAQLNHPFAQFPPGKIVVVPVTVAVAVVSVLGVAGVLPEPATMVTPLLTTTVCVAGMGQDVLWQSRPTRQHPPP